MIEKMRDRIRFQKSTPEMDKNGNHILKWHDVYCCAAYANNMSGSEYWAAAQVNAETDMYFMVRSCSELRDLNTEQYRILFRDGKYDITFIDNIQYEDRMLKIRVKKAVEQWEA